MSKFFAHIVFAFVAILVASATAEVRIVAGEEITIDKVPYLVQLKKLSSGATLCGGTLVTPTHVVTAAHCLTNSAKEDWLVVGGASRTDEIGERRLVVKAFLNENYDDDLMSHDIAVLKLSAPMPLGKNIQTIPLCSSPVPDGDLIQVSGWGAMKGNLHPDQVRTIRVPRMPFEECRNKYSYLQMTETMMCAADAVHTERYTRADVCVGDSGGPGYYAGELCAVVSWGRDCGQSGYPGVYTDITTVIPFLANALSS